MKLQLSCTIDVIKKHKYRILLTKNGNQQGQIKRNAL